MTTGKFYKEGECGGGAGSPLPKQLSFQECAFACVVQEHAFVGQREVFPFLEFSTTINIGDAARGDCD